MSWGTELGVLTRTRPFRGLNKDLVVMDMTLAGAARMTFPSVSSLSTRLSTRTQPALLLFSHPTSRSFCPLALWSIFLCFNGDAQTSRDDIHVSTMQNCEKGGQFGR